MPLFSAHPLLLGNFNPEPYKEYGAVTIVAAPFFYFVLESHESYRMIYPVFCGSDEKQPLCHEVGDKDEIVAVWNRADELMPREDEIREYEKYRTQGEDAAALKHGGYEHGADKSCVYAYSDAHDSMRYFRNYPAECECEQCQGTEYYHRDIAFGLACQFAVHLHLLEVPVDEIYYEPYVS